MLLFSASAAATPKMTYKQLEDQMNKWWMELDHQEKVFLEQATKVNAWDKMLIQNGQKVKYYHYCGDTPVISKSILMIIRSMYDYQFKIHMLLL